MPQKPVYLNKFEDIAVRLKPEDKSKFYVGMKGSGKFHKILDTTNIATWALLEDIKKIKGE